ncbi:hypothetical protein LINGRAHAP2_LOCUS25686 [Linum grandiflorum]
MLKPRNTKTLTTRSNPRAAFSQTTAAAAAPRTSLLGSTFRVVEDSGFLTMNNKSNLVNKDSSPSAARQLRTSSPISVHDSSGDHQKAATSANVASGKRGRPPCMKVYPCCCTYYPLYNPPQMQLTLEQKERWMEVLTNEAEPLRLSRESESGRRSYEKKKMNETKQNIRRDGYNLEEPRQTTTDNSSDFEIDHYEDDIDFEISHGGELQSCRRSYGKKKMNQNIRRNGAPATYNNPEAPRNSSEVAPPSFRVTMTETYITCGYAYIPSSFRKTYMRKESQVVEVKVDNGKKVWEMKMSIWGKKLRHARITTGWSRFVRDNHLQVGNTQLLIYVVHCFVSPY